MSLIVKVLLLLLLAAVLLSAAALTLNDVPLSQEPGLTKRLLVYLSRNHVQTEPDHPFPELRPATYPVDAETLFERTRKAIVGLGWQIKTIDPSTHSLHAVISTPLLGFKDDLTARVEGVDATHSTLYLESRSRVGRADFGANLGHVMKLQSTLAQGKAR